MKKIILFLLICAFSQTMRTQTIEDYREIFQSKIEVEEQGTGFSAVFVDETGTKFLNFGNQNKNSAPTTENTIYEIGSVTKVFTGILLAEAVKRGEVKLDDPISKFLPKNQKTPKFNGKEITLLDLATHSSGLPRLPDNLQPKDELNPYVDYDEQKLYQFLEKYELKREIGETFEYSNLGVGLLGHLLSLRAKMSYEQLVTSRILKPLKMNDTSLSLPKTKVSRHAQGFNDLNEPMPNWFFLTLSGAGAIRSTASDMAKFISVYLGLTKSSLSVSFAEAATMRRKGQNVRAKSGLCWQNIDLFGTETLWHGGATGGFSSFLAISPNAKKGAFLVRNMSGSGSSVVLENIAFNWINKKFPLMKPKKQIVLSNDLLEQYVGEYQIAANFSIFVTLEGGKLFARPTGEGSIEIFPEEKDSFFAKIAGISIKFQRNSEGKVESLIIIQSGVNTPAKKVK